MKRNICICGAFSNGGTEKAAFVLANELKTMYTVYIINLGNHTPSFYLDSAITYKKIKDNSIINRIGKLTCYLKQQKIDILITVEAMTGIITTFAAKITGCKHIIWEHANYYQTQGSRWISRVRQMELISANAYVVLTKRDQENFKKNFKVRCKLKQIYNIVGYSNTINRDNNTKVILSAGHFRKVKQFDLIPEIGKIVFQSHKDWVWRIYGDSDNSYAESIKHKIIEYGLEKNILFCGRNNNMDQVYEEAAMYVLTSKYEGLPLVLLEAKEHKVPIVSFDIETGPDEIIMDGVNGFLVSPNNIEEMADKILCLIENEELRLEFSDNSNLEIEKFSKDIVVNRWVRLFEELF